MVAKISGMTDTSTRTQRGPVELKNNSKYNGQRADLHEVIEKLLGLSTWRL